MEFILFFAVISLIAQSCQLICYAAHVRKSGRAYEPAVASHIAVDMG